MTGPATGIDYDALVAVLVHELTVYVVPALIGLLALLAAIGVAVRTLRRMSGPTWSNTGKRQGGSDGF